MIFFQKTKATKKEPFNLNVMSRDEKLAIRAKYKKVVEDDKSLRFHFSGLNTEKKDKLKSILFFQADETLRRYDLIEELEEFVNKIKRNN